MGVLTIFQWWNMHDKQLVDKWPSDPVAFMDSLAWPGHVRSYQRTAFAHSLLYPRMVHLWCSNAGKRVFSAALALWYALFHTRPVLIIEPTHIYTPHSFGKGPLRCEEQIITMHKMYSTIPEEQMSAGLGVRWDTDHADFASGSRVVVKSVDEIARAKYLNSNYGLVIINSMGGNRDHLARLAPALFPCVASMKNCRMLISCTGGEKGTTLEQICADAIDVTGKTERIGPEGGFHISKVVWSDVIQEPNVDKYEMMFAPVEYDPYTKSIKKMNDSELLEELDNIRKEKQILENHERIVQDERSRRYSIDNSFLEEINSTEAHIP